jgi:protease-4
MLATVADEIWMDPLGDLDIKGVAFGRSYYRRMLDKMGVGIDEWRYFTYKSAMETFSRTSMSDPDREQFQAFADDWYDEATRLARTARGIDEATWNTLRDEKGELLAKEAKEAGLVDRIGDFHDATEKADSAAVRTTADLVAVDLRGLLGDQVWGPEEWGNPPQIALLYAIGECDMDKGIKGRQLSKEIRSMRENAKIEAVVMRADSPGGDALPSDLVSRELKLTQKDKPVLVSQGQIAGSGGYWISMHSDSIYASPFTLTGSIGVISAHVWDDSLGHKIGMDYDHVQVGKHADIDAGPSLPLIGVSLPYRPVTEEERQRAETIMKDLYWDFVGQASEGRGLTPEAIDAIGQGRIWSGTDGLGNGLVDKLDGLWGSLVDAKKAAGIPANRPVEIVEGPGLGAFDLSFLRPRIPGFSLPWFGGKAKAEEAPPLLAGEPWNQLPRQERAYLEQLLGADGKPLLIMKPIAVEGATLEP